MSVCIPVFMDLENKTKNEVGIERNILLKNTCNSPSWLLNWKISFQNHDYTRSAVGQLSD